MNKVQPADFSVSPFESGIIDEEPTLKVKRGLTLMCKIMQNIANHLQFTKENHMRTFNEFLKTNFEAGRRSVLNYMNIVCKHCGKWNGFFDQNSTSKYCKPLLSMLYLTQSNLKLFTVMSVYMYCTKKCNTKWLTSSGIANRGNIFSIVLMAYLHIYFYRFFTEIASDGDIPDTGNHSLSFINDANVLALHRLLWNNQEKIGDYLSSSRYV